MGSPSEKRAIMSHFSRVFMHSKASLCSIILCWPFDGTRAINLRSWNDELMPFSATSSFRQSRARIRQDDVAFLNKDMDIDPVSLVSTESIVDEAYEVVTTDSSVAFEQKDTWERIQLSLASSTESQSANSLSEPTSFRSNHNLRSTGTTIVGCLVEEGRYVVLGADTRATDDRMVADKRCEKIHRISPNIWCCGAGTSADLEAITRLAQYSMALQALQESTIGNDETKVDNGFSPHGGILLQPISVSSACRFLRDELYSAGGGLGVNLILGGYDDTGKMTAIHPHGSMDVVPYAALGSGGLAAMAVLESRYRPTLSLQEGIELVRDAVLAGIENDLGSGSQVDLCVLGPKGFVNYTRAMVPEQELIETKSEDVAEPIMKQTGSSGVNGFGNLPYAVNSRRVMASIHDETTRMEKWNDLLGLK